MEFLPVGCSVEFLEVGLIDGFGYVFMAMLVEKNLTLGSTKKIFLNLGNYFPLKTFVFAEVS